MVLVGENEWEHQLEVVLKARAILKTRAPVLNDQVFSPELSQVCKDVKATIPDAVAREVVFFWRGRHPRKRGKETDTGKFSWLALVFVVVEQLLIRLTIGVVPAAIKIIEAEYRKMADEIINQPRKAGVVIHDADISMMLTSGRSWNRCRSMRTR